MPERIQRRRYGGYVMPAAAIYVGRPTKWGNPFQISSNRRDLFVHDGMRVLWSTPRSEDALTTAREFAVSAYHPWLVSGSLHGLSQWEPRPELLPVRTRILGDLRSLADRDLACWCPLSDPCHADVLLELANQELAHGYR